MKVQCFHCLKAGVLRPHACLSSHSQPAVIQLLKNKPLRHNKCSRSVFSAAEKMEPIDSAQIQGNADRKERASEPADDHLSPQDHEDKETDSVGVKIALSALRFYKREISPILPPSCRFIPTCSEYAMDSFKQHGVRKGFILTSWRLLRCNPFGVIIHLSTCHTLSQNIIVCCCVSCSCDVECRTVPYTPG